MNPRIDPGSSGHLDLNRYTKFRTSIYADISEERRRQDAAAIGGDTPAFDKQNTPNDWIALVTAYLGRAAQRCVRNEREGQDYRTNLIKAAALIVAALEAHDAK